MSVYRVNFVGPVNLDYYFSNKNSAIRQALSFLKDYCVASNKNLYEFGPSIEIWNGNRSQKTYLDENVYIILDE